MWLFFALAPRFLGVFCNAADQVLSRAHPAHKTASVLILNYCASLPLAVVAYGLSGGVSVPPRMLFWVAGAVLAYVGALIPYYKALQHEQSYNVVPYLALSPVLLSAMAFLFLHEQMSFVQAAGGLLVILCGFAFSWDFAHGKFKGRLFGLMAVSSFFFATELMCVKNASALAGAWTVVFYFIIGELLIGYAALAAVPALRRSIVHGLKASRGKTALLALGSEFISAFLAFAALTHAFQLAPTVAHVAALSGTRPFFAFLLAFPLARILPHHYEPVVKGREMKLKLLLFLGIFVGIYVLARG